MGVKPSLLIQYAVEFLAGLLEAAEVHILKHFAIDTLKLHSFNPTKLFNLVRFLIPQYQRDHRVLIQVFGKDDNLFLQHAFVMLMQCI